MPSGPTDDTVNTPGSSVGACRQLLWTTRSIAASGGQSGLIVSNVGCCKSLTRLPARCGHDDDPTLLCVLGRVETGVQRPLLGVVAAVVQVWIGEQAEIDDVEPQVAGVPKTRGHRIGEAVTGVSAHLDGHNRGLRSDAGDADPVDGQQ